ncbi:global transcription factor [Haematococcus lacustris]
MAKKTGKKKGDDSDDDEDFDEEELEDEEEGGRRAGNKAGGSKKPNASKKKGKKRGSKALNDADDDDDDDDDEDGRGRKRMKPRSVFIDDIADVDDDDEEEEEGEEAEDLIDDRDEIVDHNAMPVQHASMYRQFNRDQERSAEDIARTIEERYQRMEEGNHGYDDEAALAETGIVGQQALQPTPNDPKLWLIKTRPGCERELVVQLLSKHYSMSRQGGGLLIKSAVALDHLKGSVYVEADKEAHVREAIRGLRTVFVSKGVALVPLDEMVDAVTVNKKAKLSLAREAWVRVRHGLYKDDLAKVVDVDNNTLRATIRLIPRVDLNDLAAKSQMSVDERKEERRRNPFGRVGPVRPQAKPFVADDAKELGLVVTRVQGVDGQTYMQLGTGRYINGYTEREVAIKSLMEVTGMPPLEELQRFNACGAAADEARQGSGASAQGDLSSLVAALPTGASAPKTHFLKGDIVKIVKGDMTNLVAVVESLADDGKVVVRPKDVDNFTDLVDFEADELRKLFQVGDAVRVIGGTYTGEQGMVVVVSDNEQCLVVSDTTRQELKVFGRDLTRCDGVDVGVQRLGEHQLHDLVQLDQNTAGVIIGIQRDAARVLTTSSTPEQLDIRVVRAADIQRGIKARALITTDMHQNQVRQGDFVTFAASAGSGRTPGTRRGGAVEYVWRGMLFVKGKEFTDAGGFVCVKAAKCNVRGAGSGGPTSSHELAKLVASGLTPQRTPISPSGAPYSSQGSRGGYSFAPTSPSHAFAAQAAALGSQSPHGGGEGRQGAGGGGRPPPPTFGAQPGQFSGRANGARGVHSGLVGKTVKIRGGPYHGYQGRVKHETGTHVQLELDAISGRIVTVDRKHLPTSGDSGPPDSSSGSRPAPGANVPHTPANAALRGSQWGSGSASQAPGSQWGSGSQYPTPGTVGDSQNPYGYGSRTPFHPSATPAHPSMTPAHYSSHLTPSHAPYTPMHNAMTPGDDNYGPSGAYHQEDRQQHAAPTPGDAGHGGSAYTPAMTPSMYGHDDPHTQAELPMHAPTPALGPDASGAGMHPTAATPGLAPTPGEYDPGLAPTPYLPSHTPAVTPGDLAPTPGGEGLMGSGYTPGMGLTPGAAPTPGLGPAYTPGGPGGTSAATPGVAYTPGTGGYDDMGLGGRQQQQQQGGGQHPTPQHQEHQHWVGVVVHLPGSGSGPPGQQPVGVVHSISHDGQLVVLPGAWAASGAEFVEQAGAAAQLCSPHDVLLQLPGRKSRVRIMFSDASPHLVGAVGTLTTLVQGEGIVKLDGPAKEVVVLHPGTLGRLAHP